MPAKVALIADLLTEIKNEHPNVYEIRQCGMVAGLELRQEDGTRFPYSQHVCENACLAARDHGLLIRPVLDTIVLMPPLSITEGEIRQMCDGVGKAIRDIEKEL